MPMTMLTNMIDPEVLAGMVSAKLPKKIKFSPIAAIDSTLVGQPGSTIRVPRYLYIGDASDVAEGIAMGTVTLTTATTDVTVKKAGKAIELTDESLLSGYGDPLGQSASQIVDSISAKVDNDCYNELCKASLVYDGTAKEIDYAGIVDANAKFEDESDNALTKIMFINPLQEATIRKDKDFMDKNKYGLDVVMNGTIGSIAGAQVVKSKKVKLVKFEKDNVAGTITIVADSVTEDSTNKHLDTIAVNCIDELKVGDKVKAVSVNYWACPIIITDVRDANEDATADAFATEQPVLTIYMKRDVQLESDRDILKKTTVLAADEHYVAVLSNDSKAVLAKFKA